MPDLAVKVRRQPGDWVRLHPRGRSPCPVWKRLIPCENGQPRGVASFWSRSDAVLTSCAARIRGLNVPCAVRTRGRSPHVLRVRPRGGAATVRREERVESPLGTAPLLRLTAHFRRKRAALTCSFFPRAVFSRIDPACRRASQHKSGWGSPGGAARFSVGGHSNRPTVNRPSRNASGAAPSQDPHLQESR